MTATRVNRAVDFGTTFEQNFTYLNTNDEPVDLTGATITFEIREPGVLNGTPLYSTEATGNALGEIQLKVSDEDTALWTFGKAAYRLDIEWPNGDKQRLTWGSLTVVSGVDV